MSEQVFFPSGTHLDAVSIFSHEAKVEDKRVTLYKIGIKNGTQSHFVYHRYSELRELYEKLKDTYSKEKLKFPGKRVFGNNFDPDFIESRQRGLLEFMQKVLSIPDVLSNPLVVSFFAPDHAKAKSHAKYFSAELFENETPEEEVGDGPSPQGTPGPVFDLGKAEDKKAKINDFQLLKVIGKGSFGKVILAKHKSSNKHFAIKVLSKDLIIKQNEVRHIMSERNVLLGNVHHPFLVALHFSFQSASKLYFVLDYVNGGELFFHLQKEKKFSVPRSLFYSAEITSAIGYLHSLNIVYRDLKPENILLDYEGHIKLTDFGLAKEGVMPGESTSTFCGTPEYLAPEVLRKQSYGRAVDWWCLGCVTFEMLTGLPPFYSRDCHEMYDRILHDKLRFPDHVPMKARAFLEGLLRRQADQRLGGGPGDVLEVKSHMFYAGLDWDALEKRAIPPPFNPNVSGNLDFKNFDPEFVNEPVSSPGQSVRDPSKLGGRSLNGEAFDGFSYTGHRLEDDDDD